MYQRVYKYRKLSVGIATSTTEGVCSIVISVSVCLFVCLSGRIFQKVDIIISPNFLYMLAVAMARSSSYDSAICYVLPVLWMTSCFRIMGPMGQNQSDDVMFG